MSAPVVVAEGLSKSFGDAIALDNLTLELEAGRVLGFLGPNGAGKTTTMRLLMGLLKPTSGRAELFGHDVWEMRDLIHRNVGYLPGDFVAYPDLTADQYLSYLANLRGDVDWSRVLTLAERFGLDMARPTGSLSHGNRRKVGLVQAFMHAPRLLLLDEPTSGLDPLMQREFLTLVRESRASGCTVVLSSHALDEVEAVADDVALVREGRLVVVAPIDSLKANVSQRLDVTFTDAAPEALLAAIPSVASVSILGRTANIVVNGSLDDLFRAAASHGIESVVAHGTDLEDVFVSYFEEDQCSTVS